ncbi:MAG TPA: hypothetical protein VF135_12730 [Terriglobales bacterium]
MRASTTLSHALKDDSGSVTFHWIPVLLALLLFLSMTGLETLLYRVTGCGYLAP